MISKNEKEIRQEKVKEASAMNALGCHSEQTEYGKKLTSMYIQGEITADEMDDRMRDYYKRGRKE